MKIEHVETLVVGNPWKNWVFVIVHTDSGPTGLGEATAGLSTRAQVSDVEELSQVVIGEDPRNPGAIYHKMLRARFLKPSAAMSGIEIACWDILGRHLGVPVWQLLGGKLRDTLRAYANGWYRGPREPGFFAERAAQMVALGYTALKFDPFGAAYLEIDSENEDVAIHIVAAVRDAVGDRVDLLIEGHDRFTIAAAERIAPRLAEYRSMWFETPVFSHDIAATSAVAARMPVAVAAGERYTLLSEFSELLGRRSVSIVQPEPMNLGFSNTIKACGIAESYGAMVACHQAQSPLCTAVIAHIHAAVPNFLIQEHFDDSLEPWTWDVLAGTPRAERGYLRVPDTPGFGVELDVDEARKHPFGARNFLRLFEPGWESRRPGED